MKSAPSVQMSIHLMYSFHSFHDAKKPVSHRNGAKYCISQFWAIHISERDLQLDVEWNQGGIRTRPVFKGIYRVDINIMEFCFINNNAPLDRRSQKLVRHHAMKGKNTGKTIRLRGHKRQQHKGEIQLDRWTTESSCYLEGGKGRPLLPKLAQANSLLPINPFSGTELTYFSTSVPLTPSVRYLFHECTSHLCSCSFSRWTLKVLTMETVSSPQWSVQKALPSNLLPTVKGAWIEVVRACDRKPER